MSATTTEARAPVETLAETVIKEHCKQLHLPAISGQCARLAEHSMASRSANMRRTVGLPVPRPGVTISLPAGS